MRFVHPSRTLVLTYSLIAMQDNADLKPPNIPKDKRHIYLKRLETGDGDGDRGIESSMAPMDLRTTTDGAEELIGRNSMIPAQLPCPFDMCLIARYTSP